MTIDKITVDHVNRLGKNGCYLEFSDNGAWKLTQLNCIERFFRWLGCFYANTTLLFVAGKVGVAPALSEALKAKMFGIFNRSYPGKENPFSPKPVLIEQPKDVAVPKPNPLAKVDPVLPPLKDFISPEKISIGASSICFQVGNNPKSDLFVYGRDCKLSNGLLYGEPDSVGEPYENIPFPQFLNFDASIGTSAPVVSFYPADAKKSEADLRAMLFRYLTCLHDGSEDAMDQRNIRSIDFRFSTLIDSSFPTDRAIRVALEACADYLKDKEDKFEVKFVFKTGDEKLKAEFVKFAAEQVLPEKPIELPPAVPVDLLVDPIVDLKLVSHSLELVSPERSGIDVPVKVEGNPNLKQVELPPEKIIVGASSIRFEVGYVGMGAINSELTVIVSDNRLIEGIFCMGPLKEAIELFYWTVRESNILGQHATSPVVQYNALNPDASDRDLMEIFLNYLSDHTGDEINDVRSIAFPLLEMIDPTFPVERAMLDALSVCVPALECREKSCDVAFVFKEINEEAKAVFIDYAA